MVGQPCFEMMGGATGNPKMDSNRGYDFEENTSCPSHLGSGCVFQNHRRGWELWPWTNPSLQWVIYPTDHQHRLSSYKAQLAMAEVDYGHQLELLSSLDATYFEVIHS